MRIVIALIFLAASCAAFADGYMFKDGRFPEGKSTVFRLTLEQKQLIALYRRCRDNTKTPYIFRLTGEQSTVLAKEAGMSPERFAIFESYRQDDGSDIEFNIINRFSEDTFEVPHQLLRAESEVRNWETNIIGWMPSPLVQVNPRQVKADACPK